MRIDSPQEEWDEHNEHNSKGCKITYLLINEQYNLYKADI